jgi:hypothetical protein
VAGVLSIDPWRKGVKITGEQPPLPFDNTTLKKGLWGKDPRNIFLVKLIFYSVLN